MNAKGVEALVHASTAKVEVMSVALVIVESRVVATHESTKETDQKYSSDRDCGVDATSSGKPLASPSLTTLVTFNRTSNVDAFNHPFATGVRLHHKMV
jgi:hypothetical protein